jgi:hypothetical protein
MSIVFESRDELEELRFMELGRMCRNWHGTRSLFPPKDSPSRTYPTLPLYVPPLSEGTRSDTKLSGNCGASLRRTAESSRLYNQRPYLGGKMSS